MESMPTEILLDILDRLDLKSLSMLSLVSRKMRSLSRPLLFRTFEVGTEPPERCLGRLRSFYQQLLTDPSLTDQIRSISVRNVPQADIGEVQDIFKFLLERTPNLQHLKVPGAQQFTKFLKGLLKDKKYLCRLQSFTSPPICNRFIHPEYWSTLYTSL